MELSKRRSWAGALILLVGVSLALVAAALSQAAGAQDGRDEPTVEAARQVTDSPQPLRLFNSPTLAVHPDDPRTRNADQAGQSQDLYAAAVQHDELGGSGASTLPIVLAAAGGLFAARVLLFGVGLGVRLRRSGSGSGHPAPAGN